MIKGEEKFHARAEHPFIRLSILIHFTRTIPTNHRQVLLLFDAIQRQEKTRARDVKHHIRHITKINEFDVEARD